MEFMVWWIPTSWAENLGSAERVSLYHVEIEKLGFCRYSSTIMCNVRLSGGDVERHFCAGYGTTPETAITRGKRNLRDEIRVLYQTKA